MCPICVNYNFGRLPFIHIKIYLHQAAVLFLPHLAFLIHVIQTRDLLKIFSNCIFFVCLLYFFMPPLLHTSYIPHISDRLITSSGRVVSGRI